MATSKIRAILEYDFLRIGLTQQKLLVMSVLCLERIRLTNASCFFWKRFRSGNFDLKSESRGGPATKANNDDLKVMWKLAYPNIGPFTAKNVRLKHLKNWCLLI